jgi:hypothetical protein
MSSAGSANEAAGLVHSGGYAGTESYAMTLEYCTFNTSSRHLKPLLQSHGCGNSNRRSRWAHFRRAEEREADADNEVSIDLE